MADRALALALVRTGRKTGRYQRVFVAGGSTLLSVSESFFSGNVPAVSHMVLLIEDMRVLFSVRDRMLTALLSVTATYINEKSEYSRRLEPCVQG